MDVRVKLSYLVLRSVSFSRIISQKFLYQIDMGHNHSAATVPLASKLIHGVTIGYTLIKKLKITFPEISDNLAARKTADGDNHLV